MSWFNPSKQLSPTQLLAHSPHNGTEERIRRVKVRKLMGWDTNSLKSKAKALCASKASQGINSLPPIGRQVFSHPQKSRAPSHVMVTWEGKHHRSKRPPLPYSSPSFHAEHDVIWYGTSLWLVGSAVPAVSPPSFLCTPSLLTDGVV